MRSHTPFALLFQGYHRSNHFIATQGTQHLCLRVLPMLEHPTCLLICLTSACLIYLTSACLLVCLSFCFCLLAISAGLCCACISQHAPSIGTSSHCLSLGSIWGRAQRFVLWAGCHLFLLAVVDLPTSQHAFWTHGPHTFSPGPTHGMPFLTLPTPTAF